MKVLFIGGTGNISTPVSRLAMSLDVELYHLNRGTSIQEIPGVITLQGDINEPLTQSLLSDHYWDSVVNWIAYTPADIERDLILFKDKTRQYIFISSASCYQRPVRCPIITESTPLANPYWQYSRDKIDCEYRLMGAYHLEGFPVTIVRPSLTYDTVIPISVGGFREYTTAQRILDGRPVLVPGDGTALWTVTHADDFAKGFMGLVGNYHALGHAFHITSDEILNWNTIYRTLAEALNREIHMVHVASETICRLEPDYTGTLLGDKCESTIFDNTKIKTFVPGYQATIPFHTGIRRTLAWLDAHPAKKIVDQASDATIDRIIKAAQSLTI